MKKSVFAIIFLILTAFILSISASAQTTVISLGADYSLVTPASEAYPNDGEKLTDGMFGTVPEGKNNYYSSGEYVGFNQADTDEDGNFVIILELAETYNDISGFSIGFLNEPSVGIFAPKSVSFSLSDERNGEYDDIGTLNTAKPTSATESQTYNMTLATDDISGRYLKVTVAHLGEYTDDTGATKTAGWTFLDEITVMSSADSGNSESSENESSQPQEESSPESSAPTEESETSQENSKPQTGDDGLSVYAFVLLALSALCMMLSLFVSNRRNDF